MMKKCQTINLSEKVNGFIDEKGGHSRADEEDESDEEYF